MNVKDFHTTYLDQLKNTLDRIDFDGFKKVLDLILDAYAEEKHIFVMGNGGSGSTASHFACDINKGCCVDLGKKFKMICLNDNMPTMLAIANDISYEAVFEAQLTNFFEPGDLVIGISGSGNSANVLKAIEYAKKHEGITAGMCGFEGGALAKLVDVALVAPVNDMQKVEDVHMIWVHMLMQAVYAALHSDALPGC
jgi:D-sedoheptulose 7-phosphate isomerase